MATPVPKQFRTLTPYLVVKDAARAIDFYKRAFGAEETMRIGMDEGKTIAHAELRIGDSMLMLSDEFPHSEVRAPESTGAATGGVMIYVENVDALFERAVAAGATVKQPVSDMFWGDRTGNLADPFGHFWSIATHKEDLTPAEIAERAKAFQEKMASKGAGE